MAELQKPTDQEMKAPTDDKVAAMEGGAKPEEDGGCNCCTWLIYIVTAPFLLVLWLLGALLWLILLPLKCCCPCLGVPLGWATKLMMRLLRLPFRILRWIAGSPWESEEEDEERRTKEEE